MPYKNNKLTVNLKTSTFWVDMSALVLCIKQRWEVLEVWLLHLDKTDSALALCWPAEQEQACRVTIPLPNLHRNGEDVQIYAINSLTENNDKNAPHGLAGGWSRNLHIFVGELIFKNSYRIKNWSLSCTGLQRDNTKHAGTPFIKVDCFCR